MKRNVPVWLLLVVIAACLAPIFLLASEVDGDEFAKSGLSIATVAAIVTVYRMWSGGDDAQENR